jgi:quercetin dioxygenase-like cupin family protein
VKQSTLFVSGTLLGAAVAVAGMAIASAELDPVKLSPQLYTVRLENEHVRVYEYRIGPGRVDPMHAHPHGLMYIIGGGRMRSTSPGGAVSDADLKAGDVIWRESLSHSLENIGTSEVHVLSVELKR